MLETIQTMAANISIFSSFKKLNSQLFQDRKDITAVYVFAILSGIVQLSLPLGIQSIIGFVMAGSISTSIIVLIFMVVFGVFVNGLLQVRQLQIIEKIKQKIFFRYSFEYANRIPKLDLEKLDSEYLPELVNRFFDSVSLQKGVDKLLLDLPTAIIQVLLGLLLLSFYHPIFIGFGFLLLIIILAIIRYTSPQGLATAMKASSYKYGVVAWLQEMARSVKTFKYSKDTEMHIKNTDALVSNYLVSKNQHFSILMLQFWSLISFKIIVTASMLILGSYLLVNQEINVGQFIAADIVIISIIASIEKIITNLDSVYDALVSIEKLNVVTEASVDKSGSILMEVKNEGLKVKVSNLSFAYGKNTEVIKNINFEIDKGKILQLKGVSGAGKSTIMRLFTGAYNQFTGEISLDGIPIRNFELYSLRKSMGIFLSNHDIFNDTLLHNITMNCPGVSIDEVTKVVDLTGFSEFMNESSDGYETILQPLGGRLSSKVRHTILLMRALLGDDNRLLLLEDPFEYLEEPHKTNVKNYLKNLKNCTIIFASSSDLGTFPDKVVEISKDGELILPN